MEKWDNYEIMTEQARKRFLTHDQKVFMERWNLQEEEGFLYLKFTGQWYRIHRMTGHVERMEPGSAGNQKQPYDRISQDGERGGGRWIKAGFEEVMTIYDVLCYPNQKPELSGKWCSVYNLGHVVHRSKHNIVEYIQYETLFDHKLARLEEICQQMGGKPENRGDLCYILPVFDFLPVKFQFWESDEEFPAKLQFFWDEKTLDFIHFETTFYAVCHILRKMASEL